VAAREIVAEVRTGVPAFLEIGVFRVRPHSIADPDYRYRPRTAGAEWMESNDPIANWRSRLEPELGERLDEIDEQVAQEVAAARERAEAAEQTPVANAKAFVYTTPELEQRA
jgi:TPP-dependent pyruvate/acetoin dehydrogenase alpha subunit